MTRVWGLILALVLGTACASEDKGELEGVTSLKVDLDAVVASGTVAPVDGVSTAGQPDAAGFEVFANEGYVAVIDLRTDGEDRGLDAPATVEGLGMEYISMPIGRDDITFDKAAELFDLLDEFEEPVLVYCGSANRVGALFALNEFAETGDAELALEVGREAGLTRLEGTVEKIIGAESN